MVGAAGAEVRELLCLRGVYELEDLREVGKASDPALLARDDSAQIGHDGERDLCAICAGLSDAAAEVLVARQRSRGAR